MGMSFGAFGQELFSTSLHPTLYLLVRRCQCRDAPYSRLVLLVPEDPLRVPLDKDLETRIDQLLGGSRRDGSPTLEFLLFAAEPEGLDCHAG